jgi:phosphatidylglycerol:prolipoprotein diacylglycerol transferase
VHPVLFEIDGRAVGTFGVLVAVGFLIAAQWVWPRLLARHGADRERDPARSAIVALWVLVGVLLGGRLLFASVEVLRHLTGQSGEQSLGALFLERPWLVLDPRGGGMVMYGGLFGGMALGALAARRVGLALGRALDTGLVAGFFGLAIGRVGCFMVGDDHGRAVHEGLAWLPFPFAYRIPDVVWLEANAKSLFERELAGQVVYATQTYMALNALALAWLGAHLLERRLAPGRVALILLACYGVTRSAIECLRGDRVRGVWFEGTWLGDTWLGGVSTSQLVSGPLVIVALVLLARRRA